MLKWLHIKNLALVKEAALDFDSGFNAVTGETGAGKSVLMGGLRLLLGARFEKSAIREGIRKPYIVSWQDLCKRHEGKTLYIDQCARFLRIRSEDRKLEIIMSNRYKPEIPMFSELLDLKDFGPVQEERQESKKLKRKLRRKSKKNQAVESV